MWNNFDNSMQNEGGFMDTSRVDSLGGEDKSNVKRAQNCIPVMIVHMVRHGEKLTVWGITARIVTFVAVVRNLEALSTKVTFEFEDETGSIKGIKWLEGDTGNYESPVKVNSYARIFGLIREQNDDHYVLIVNIQPLEHLNELLTHLMEVTLMSLQGSAMVNDVSQQDFSSRSQSVIGSSQIEINGVNGTGLTAQQQIILNIIQDSDPEYGAERHVIKARAPPHLVNKVDEIIEFLSAEGHIYTTKTDDFFKAI